MKKLKKLVTFFLALLVFVQSSGVEVFATVNGEGRNASLRKSISQRSFKPKYGNGGKFTSIDFNAAFNDETDILIPCYQVFDNKSIDAFVRVSIGEMDFIKDLYKPKGFKYLEDEDSGSFKLFIINNYIAPRLTKGGKDISIGNKNLVRNLEAITHGFDNNGNQGYGLNHAFIRTEAHIPEIRRNQKEIHTFKENTKNFRNLGAAETKEGYIKVFPGIAKYINKCESIKCKSPTYYKNENSKTRDFITFNFAELTGKVFKVEIDNNTDTLDKEIEKSVKKGFEEFYNNNFKSSGINKDSIKKAIKKERWYELCNYLAACFSVGQIDVINIIKKLDIKKSDKEEYLLLTSIGIIESLKRNDPTKYLIYEKVFFGDKLIIPTIYFAKTSVNLKTLSDIDVKVEKGVVDSSSSLGNSRSPLRRVMLSFTVKNTTKFPKIYKDIITLTSPVTQLKYMGIKLEKPKVGNIEGYKLNLKQKILEALGKKTLQEKFLFKSAKLNNIGEIEKIDKGYFSVGKKESQYKVIDGVSHAHQLVQYLHTNEITIVNLDGMVHKDERGGFWDNGGLSSTYKFAMSAGNGAKTFISSINNSWIKYNTAKTVYTFKNKDGGKIRYEFKPNAMMFGLDRENIPDAPPTSISVKSRPKDEKVAENQRDLITYTDVTLSVEKDKEKDLLKGFKESKGILTIELDRSRDLDGSDNRAAGPDDNKKFFENVTYSSSFIKDNVTIEETSEDTIKLRVEFPKDTKPEKTYKGIFRADKPFLNFEDQYISFTNPNWKAYYRARAILKFPDHKSKEFKNGISFTPIGAETSNKFRDEEVKPNTYAADWASFKKEPAKKVDFDFEYNSNIEAGYAEVKNNTAKIDGSGENWEVMGGEPTTEKDYLAVGGDAYSVDLKGDVVTDKSKTREITINILVDNDWLKNEMDQWGLQTHCFPYHEKSGEFSYNNSKTGDCPATCYDEEGEPYDCKKSRTATTGGALEPPSDWCVDTDETWRAPRCKSVTKTKNIPDKTVDCVTATGKTITGTYEACKEQMGVHKTDGYANHNDNPTDAPNKHNAIDFGGRCPDYGQGKKEYGIYTRHINEYHPIAKKYTYKIKIDIDDYKYLDITALKADSLNKYRAEFNSNLYKDTKKSKNLNGKTVGFKYYVNQDTYKTNNGRLAFGPTLQYIKSKMGLDGHHSISSVSEDNYGNPIVNMAVDCGWGINEAPKLNDNKSYKVGTYGVLQRGDTRSKSSATAKKVLECWIDLWNESAEKTDADLGCQRVTVISDYVTAIGPSHDSNKENYQTIIGNTYRSKPIKLSMSKLSGMELTAKAEFEKSTPAKMTDEKAKREMLYNSKQSNLKMQKNKVNLTIGYNGQPLEPAKKFQQTTERLPYFDTSSYGTATIDPKIKSVLAYWDGSKIEDLVIPQQPKRSDISHSQYASRSSLFDSMCINGLEHTKYPVNGSYLPADVYVSYSERFPEYSGTSQKYKKKIKANDRDESGSGKEFKCGYTDNYAIEDSFYDWDKMDKSNPLQTNPVVIHDPVSTQHAFIHEVPNTDQLDDRWEGEIMQLKEDGTREKVHVGKEKTKNARYLFLGHSFELEVPWEGDFEEAEKHGLLQPTEKRLAIPGKPNQYGYRNGMNTKKWTAVRYARFPFGVSYIDTNGEKCSAEKGVLVPIYASSELNGTYVNNVCKQERPNVYKFNILTSSDEYAAENVDVVSVSKNAPVFAVNGKTQTEDPNKNITNLNEYEPVNKMAVGRNLYRTNTLTNADFTADHDCDKLILTDLVGFIGGLTINDSGDFRLQEMFKKKIPGQEKNQKGVPDPVDESKPNMTVSDNINALKNELPAINSGPKKSKNNTGWTKFHAIFDTMGQVEFGMNGKNGWYHELPLTSEMSTRPEFRNEPLRPGYPLFMDIETVGNYMDCAGDGSERLIIEPKYYWINSNTNKWESVNIYSKYSGKETTIYKPGLVEKEPSYVPVQNFFLNYEDEKLRRSVSQTPNGEEERTITGAPYAYRNYRFIHYSTDDILRNSRPNGNRIWIGNSLMINLKGNARTYNGANKVYGVGQLGTTVLENKFDTDIDNITDDAFGVHGQRWHFTTGLPSNVRFTDSLGKDLKEFKDSKGRPPVVLQDLRIFAKGSVWTLRYDGENAINKNKEIPNPPSDKVIPPPPVGGNPPPEYTIPEVPIVIYNTNKSSKDDLRIQGTH